MDNGMLKAVKARCLRELRECMPMMRETLVGIDERLWKYVEGALEAVPGTDAGQWPAGQEGAMEAEPHGTVAADSVGNVYELLGIRKMLRKMVSYPMNVERARQWLRAIEGTWKDGAWVSGGVKFDTPRGAAHVRLMPYQAWCVFGMMMFEHDVEMGDGTVDRRRLCSEADLFLTRKNGKTELGASFDFAAFACMNDANEQVSIVANDAKQGQIAFKAIKSYCYQVDPASINKFGGKVFKVNAKDVSFLPTMPRTASIQVFSAGGKAKDGWNSGWVHNDEPGQGRYVNDHNDMESTVQELVGSAGVRRERMRLNTTTAGKVVTGPYKEHIERVERELLKEMDIEIGAYGRLESDFNFALLLRLDPWDFDGNVEALDKEYLFRRVNRSIGVTVQPTWYRERIYKALNGTEDERKEILTKDFNIWQTSRVNEWVSADSIRRLQVERRIDDCVSDDGWMVFVGMDFSMGDDLHAVSYLAVRDREDGSREFFADMDAWVSEDGYLYSPQRLLYEMWINRGYLHLSPGRTLEPTLPVERIGELYEKGVHFLGFGYDSYKAKTPINALAAWMVEITGDVRAPKDYIVSVSQTYASYNPVVEEMDYMIKAESGMISFSMNPMWPWEFGNCMLDVDTRYENKKPVKRGENEKVDNVQCLLSALMMYDRADGREIRE